MLCSPSSLGSLVKISRSTESMIHSSTSEERGPHMSDPDELIELKIGALRMVPGVLHAMIRDVWFMFDSPFQARGCAHVSSIHTCCMLWAEAVETFGAQPWIDSAWPAAGPGIGVNSPSLLLRADVEWKTDVLEDQLRRYRSRTGCWSRLSHWGGAFSRHPVMRIVMNFFWDDDAYRMRRE